MTFEANRSLPTQQHFYVVEVDLPIITGTCEITAGNEGYGTPLSCPIKDGTSAVSTKTYYFCTQNAPVPIGIPNCYRCVLSVNEQATELKSGQGLAVRGRATITFADFAGLDPNPERDSTAAIKNQGTFFGKFSARNIFENHEVRIKKYRKSASLDLTTDAQTTYYIMRELSSIGNGKYQLGCADELSNIEFDQAQLPATQDGFLRLDLNSSDTDIPVDPDTDWEEFDRPYVITIGEELLTVYDVTGNDTATPTLQARARGSDIGVSDFSEFISGSIAEEHSAGDEVFINLTYDDMNIANVLSDLLQRTGIPSSIIPITDWLEEVNLWHSTDSNITTTFYESNNAADTILQILEPYMFDMWFDPVAREIKLSAISKWQESSSTLTEGREIDFGTLNKKQVETMRFSRAYIGYDKGVLTSSNDDSSFKSGSIARNTDIETFSYYGKPKAKKFKNSHIIKKDTGDLLVTRFVQRFGFTPVRYSWITQERNLTFSTGDVKNLSSPEIQDIDGSANSNVRAQITKIQPIYGSYGREYKCEALSYASAQPTDEPQYLNGGADVNLYFLIGNPIAVATYTFILDGGTYSSTSQATPAIRAGAFPVGSKLIIIVRNGGDWQAKGGDASNYEGKAGGICYSADGVNTDIYLSGADPEGGTASGSLRSPGGGGGTSASFDDIGGGGGGAGISVGAGAPGFPANDAAAQGGDGDTSGAGGAGGVGVSGAAGGDGGDWGQAGQDASGSNIGSDGLGGDAGKGLVKGGATVTLYGSTALNFINGGGDAPD